MKFWVTVEHHGWVQKALHHLGSERKPRCFINTNTSRHLTNVHSGSSFFEFLSTQLYPISLLGIGLLLISSIKSRENLQQKKRRKRKKTGRALFPWAPIKTSFGKVAAFYPSLSQCVFATSLYKLQERSSESRLLETKSQVREEGGDEIG